MALVPIYQHRSNAGFLRFLYTTLHELDGKSWNSVPSDDVQNWSADGIAFYGCDATDQDAVPVYQYYAPLGTPYKPADAQKYFYTLNKGKAGDGWYPTNNDNPAFYVYGAPDCGLARFTMWYIAMPQFSYFLGCNPQTAVIGNFQSPSGWLPVGWDIAPGEGSQPFYALPGAVQLVYTPQNLLVPKLPNGSPRLVGEQFITNLSKDATIAQDLSYSLTLSSSVTLSFTETLSVSNERSINVDIPGVGGISEKITLSVDLSSTQTSTQTTDQSVQISSIVTVPPLLSVTVSGIVYVLTNYSIDASVDVLITTESNNVPLSIALPPTAQYPCTALKQMFLQQNPSYPPDSLVTDPAQGAIQLSLDAILTCSFGVNSELMVTDNPAGTPASQNVATAKI